MKSILLILCAASVLLAKSYEITSVEIIAQLQPDGSMAVTESRTYHFHDSFTFAFRTFPKSDSVQFSNFSIAEQNTNYRQADGETNVSTFIINEDEDKYEVRWYYRANNETRTFDIHYTVKNLVKNYADASLLYFQFVSDEWDHKTREAFIKILPPASDSTAIPIAWLHAPLNGTIQILTNGIITAQCSPLPRHRFMEIRALYPTHFFPQALTVNKTIRDNILDEEAAWAEEANLQRQKQLAKQQLREQHQREAKFLIPIIVIFALWGWWRLYQKYGKRPTIPASAKMRGDAPTDIPPAELSYLYYSKMISGTTVFSTMLHLAQRNFIKMEESEDATKRFDKTVYKWKLDREFFTKNYTTLKDYEATLLEFLFDELAHGKDEITVKEISKHANKFQKFFITWQKQIEAAAKQHHWYDEKSSAGLGWSLGLTFLVFAVATYGFIFIGVMAWPLAAAGLFILFASFTIPHRTKEGQIRFNEWKAFVKYLQSHPYRNASFDSLKAQMNNYFVYAPLFGLGKKFYQEMVHIIPTDQAPYFLYWYVMMGHNHTISPEAFSKGFSSMMEMSTAVMASASGAGGGASAGGGGGVSAGGGGAG